MPMGTKAAHRFDQRDSVGSSAGRSLLRWPGRQMLPPCAFVGLMVDPTLDLRPKPSIERLKRQRKPHRFELGADFRKARGCHPQQPSHALNV
jgi:hypothetical protein